MLAWKEKSTRSVTNKTSHGVHKTQVKPYSSLSVSDNLKTSVILRIDLDHQTSVEDVIQNDIKNP